MPYSNIRDAEHSFWCELSWTISVTKDYIIRTTSQGIAKLLHWVLQRKIVERNGES